MMNYNQVDQQLHLLCQIIAKANRNYLSKKEDDSHTNLYFDHLGQGIYGRWIEGKKGKIILCLNLNNQTFEWQDDALQVLQQIQITGKTITEIEQNISEQLPVLGLSPNGFTDALHYKIPEYDFAKQPIQVFDAKALQQWQSFRQLANEACLALLGHLQVDGEIRIWPHHFDTGIYVEPNAETGIGFGLAMEDEMVGAPYFYLSPYALKGEIDYSQLNSLPYGEWEIGEHWKGAVLALSTLNDLSIAQQRESIQAFLRSAVAAVLNPGPR